MFKFNFNIYIYHIMGAKQTKQQGVDLGRKDLKIINVIDYIS